MPLWTCIEYSTNRVNCFSQLSCVCKLQWSIGWILIILKQVLVCPDCMTAHQIIDVYIYHSPLFAIWPWMDLLSVCNVNFKAVIQIKSFHFFFFNLMQAFIMKDKLKSALAQVMAWLSMGGKSLISSNVDHDLWHNMATMSWYRLHYTE